MNMPSARALINSSACEGKGNPAASLISEKPFMEHLSTPVHKVDFLSNNTGKKQNNYLSRLYNYRKEM